MNFTFDTTISKEVLENYLSRCVTAAGLYESDTLEDDLRAITWVLNFSEERPESGI